MHTLGVIAEQPSDRIHSFVAPAHRAGERPHAMAAVVRPATCCMPCRTCRRLAFSGSAAPDLWALTGGSRVHPHVSSSSFHPLLQVRMTVVSTMHALPGSLWRPLAVMELQHVMLNPEAVLR
jgi:hypothetical protein